MFRDPNSDSQTRPSSSTTMPLQVLAASAVARLGNEYRCQYTMDRLNLRFLTTPILKQPNSGRISPGTTTTQVCGATVPVDSAIAREWLPSRDTSAIAETMDNNALEDFMACNLHSSQRRGAQGCWEAQLAPRHRGSIRMPISGRWGKTAVARLRPFDRPPRQPHHNDRSGARRRTAV